MPMHKKANGANFKLGQGELTFRFQSDGPSVVYVVCIWGAKPQFGGQRQKVWCSDTLTAKASATVKVPENTVMSGMQVTWSGGLIASGESQGRLLVTVEQEGAEETSYAYEYALAAKDATESFYDGLNFT